MNIPTFSLSIMHDVRVKERRRALVDMFSALGHYPAHIIDDQKPKGMLWEEFKTHLIMKQWSEALRTGKTHHIFMTDDLHIAPHFWRIVTAMCQAQPDAIWGLLSNHPKGPELFLSDCHSYRCNAWIVGPAYIMPNAALVKFFHWWLSLRDDAQAGGRRWFNDDSAINEWITYHGPGESRHPLPTCIEHRDDLASTVGHGDRYSKERVSWRRIYEPDSPNTGKWHVRKQFDESLAMCDKEYWDCGAPMLQVGGA